MESIPYDHILQCDSDTFQFIRKQFELDKPHKLEDAITILRDWLQKQDHIVMKNYSKSYLERVIIISKGSVERAKAKLDKIATYRTLLPQFFEPLDVAKVSILDDFVLTILPKMTQYYCRVIFLKIKSKHFESGFMDFYKYLIMAAEYLQSNDYSNGLIAVFDFRDTNLFELVKALNVVEMQQILAIITEGYGMRLKGIHFVTTSKAVDALIQLFKTAVSKKIAERIYTHKTMDSFYKYVPIEVLPSDYGGQAKTLNELKCELKAALGSARFMKHLRKMQNASTNENYRRDDKFNEQYMGMPGSFRKMTVD